MEAICCYRTNFPCCKRAKYWSESGHQVTLCHVMLRRASQLWMPFDINSWLLFCYGLTLTRWTHLITIFSVPGWKFKLQSKKFSNMNGSRSWITIGKSAHSKCLFEKFMFCSSFWKSRCHFENECNFWPSQCYRQKMETGVFTFCHFFNPRLPITNNSFSQRYAKL